MGKDILERAGVNVNDANNGVWLPRTSRGAGTETGIIGDAFASHDDIHTNVYITELTERLERAEEADRVGEELEFIKLEIELDWFPH